MGFTKPDFPDVDPDEFLAKPLMERMRILALNWAENGFGSPKMVHTVYIVNEKAILWTVLLEAIGVAGSWGPLAGKVKPMTGGILFWARPGTIRLRPWKWIPGTNGDRRTWLDIALYLGLLVSLVVGLVMPGVH